MTQAATFSLPRDSLQAHEATQRLTRFQRRGYQRLPDLRQNVDLNFFWTRRWFFIAMLVGFLLMIAPTPEGLTAEGRSCSPCRSWRPYCSWTEAVPLPTVPLLIIIGQVVLLKVDRRRWQSLMTDSVLFIMGSLMLAVRHRETATRPAHRLVDVQMTAPMCTGQFRSGRVRHVAASSASIPSPL